MEIAAEEQRPAEEGQAPENGSAFTKVLVADDDPITATMLSSSLKRWGYEVEQYRDGESALKRLQEPDSPRLVLLDWVMPGLYGIEVVKLLRQEKVQLPHYVIMLTSKTERKDTIEALDAGADDFISKPFDPGELQARLRVGKRMLSLNSQLLAETRKANNLADYIAHYDQVTGLPNRALLHKYISKHLETSQPFILLLMNIDRFRRVNQALGLDRGDALLRWVGVRLRDLFGREALVAREYADEFAILLPISQKEWENPAPVVEGISSKVHALGDNPPEEFSDVMLTMSIGAVTSPEDGSQTEPQTLINLADIAVKRAKAKGGNTTVIHDEAMKREIEERFALARDLRKAITEDRLKCFLQPKVDRQRRIKGAEALCRWIDKERGFVSPGEFIPVAEESDLIVELDYWMLRKVCNTLSKIDNPEVVLSSNLSPKTFYKEEFVERTKETIREAGAPPDRLILEVTEALVIEDVEAVIQSMKELNAMGVRFSIDDFGTGYSSLKYLQRLPISEIKIDRGFLLDIPDNAANMALVDAIIGIAKAMGLKIVAEGVETEEQAELLDQRAEMLHQCFLFGKPMPIDEFFTLLHLAL